MALSMGGFTYQERIMALVSTVLKKSTFQKKSHLNALGSKFDIDVTALVTCPSQFTMVPGMDRVDSVKEVYVSI